MRMFSGLSLLVLAFLVIALMLVGGPVDAQRPSLRALSSNQIASLGEEIGVYFETRYGTGPVGVPLLLSVTGVQVVSGGGAPSTLAPGTDVTASTDSSTGLLVVRGKLTSISGAYVSATWVEALRETRVYFNAIDSGISTATIVVNPPNPQFPLAVGDTFTQTIQIQEVTDLAGWQMDIAFNPGVLEVVEIAKGNFLEQDGINTLFLTEESPGKIAVKQGRTAPVPGVSGTGVLVALTFQFVSFSEALLGLHNVRLSDSSGDRLSYSVTLTPVVVTHASTAAEDVNQDGQVGISDLRVVADSIGADQPNLRADVNDDGIIDVLDLIAIVGSPDWGKNVAIVQVREPNAPALGVGVFTSEVIQAWVAQARLRNDGSLLFRRGIATLESLLAASVPSETRLLLNYPNPFNPETWIPYQLSQSADVTVRIYSVNGYLIRTLDLGHQAAGIYRSKSRAAYWDGRNELGERVAIGLYFYTLTAGDFTATRKMLIRK